MGKIDVARLRKCAGMSQRELAELLNVRPSFLSAIENGRSRMPEEKIAKLKNIFELDSLDAFIIEEPSEHIVPPHTHVMDQSDSLTSLLNHFHDIAHQKGMSHDTHHLQMELDSRIEFLSRRNDKLSERLDELREEVDKLRQENFRLKELLIKNGIKY